MNSRSFFDILCQVKVISAHVATSRIDYVYLLDVTAKAVSSSNDANAEQGQGYLYAPSSPTSYTTYYQDRCGTCAVCVVSAVQVEESSSASCVPKRIVQSMGKILDDQATLQPNGQANEASSSSIYRSRLRPPPFLPRSPAPVAEAGTSTATASVSHFLTKGTHSSSTRPPPPPRQSAMKRSPASSTFLSPVPPTPTSPHFNSILSTPMALGFQEVVVKVLGGGSTPSSGMSTPSKRISFAELPESYASTTPNGSSSSKFKYEKNRRKRKNGGEGSGNEQERTRWWDKWLRTEDLNAHGLTMTFARHWQEERMEDRTPVLTRRDYF